MWASGARFVGSCESPVLCMDWQESSSGEGGWLVTGCSNGTVGVSWIDSKEASVARNGSLEEHAQSPVGPCADEEEAGRGGWESKEAGEAGERASKSLRVPREDNLACTKEACLYKSHFILRSHTGEVSTYNSIAIRYV